MKKLTLLLLLIFCVTLTPNASLQAADDVAQRLSGRMLLQVEQNGAIWYVNPANNKRYSVTFNNALDLFKSFALGITDADLIKIPANLESIPEILDSDNDGYTDIIELKNNYSPYIPTADGKFTIDENVVNRLKGKFLLQVEQGGVIWYVDHTGVRHNIRWNNLMNTFTRLALGITDADLAKIQGETISEQSINNNLSALLIQEEDLVKESKFLQEVEGALSFDDFWEFLKYDPNTSGKISNLNDLVEDFDILKDVDPTHNENFVNGFQNIFVLTDDEDEMPFIISQTLEFKSDDSASLFLNDYKQKIKDGVEKKEISIIRGKITDLTILDESYQVEPFFLNSIYYFRAKNMIGIFCFAIGNNDYEESNNYENALLNIQIDRLKNFVNQ